MLQLRATTATVTCIRLSVGTGLREASGPRREVSDRPSALRSSATQHYLRARNRQQEIKISSSAAHTMAFVRKFALRDPYRMTEMNEALCEVRGQLELVSRPVDCMANSHVCFGEGQRNGMELAERVGAR